jgi:hypothetical protein
MRYMVLPTTTDAASVRASGRDGPADQASRLPVPTTCER